MAAAGTYSEKLPCGGTLEVTASGFRIRYYFPGPDARHKGTFVDVNGSEIEAYISAFAENWDEYQKLKATIPAGGNFQKAGKKGMQIRIGSYHQGVCIQEYHMPLDTPACVRRVIESYRYAIARANRAMTMIQSL
jgi:hypothetical protein